LKDLGIERNDIVGVLLPSRPETAVALLALYKSGCVSLSMSPLFGSEAVEYRLKDSKAKVLIVGSERKDIRKVSRGIETLKHVILVEGERLSGKELSFEETEKASTRFEPAKTSSNDPAQMFYTSGTTGPPKGTLHAQRFVLGHVPAFQLYFDLAPKENDVFWTPADWGWIGALGDVLLPALYFGMPVLAYRRKGRFDPRAVLAIMEKYRVTCAFIPPTALRMIRKTISHPAKEYDLHLRTISSAGERLGADNVIWGRQELGISINEFYGATEANLVVVTCSRIMEVKAGAMGKPCPGHTVEVLGENGNILPPGEIGEIAVKGPDPVMFLEYWNMPEATKKKFEGVWLLMSDLGFKDKEGYLWFKSRADEIIKSAGYRIGPDEVENIINQNPVVQESAVIQKPDPIRGHIVKAFIVLKDDFESSKELESEIQRTVKEKLAAYAYPREIEFVDDIPKTVTGKVKRYELKE
jgi:acetyl-CoA synthetase